MKKSRLSPKPYLLALILFAVGFSVVGAVSTSSTAAAAELTTWQKFIKKVCTGSADAIESCAQRHGDQLRDTCGSPKKNETYTKCWRKYIRDNGGTAGPDSSPYETEEAPEIEGATGCDGIDTNILSCDNKGGSPVMSLVLQIINFLAIGVGIVVVGGITYGALLYTTSNGDSSKAQQGITTIVNAVIGLLLFIFTYAIINYLVPGGVL